MKTPYLFTVIAGLLIFSTVDASEPRLDHVVVAVRDIQAAKQFFYQSGFTIKNGKVHDDGLTNAFIEFEDASEIELMSVIGIPDDPLALTYSNFLSHSEGGIFVALSGFNITKTSKMFADAGINHRIELGSLWNYLTFPADSGLEHIFLIEYKNSKTSKQRLINHKNGATGLEEVWLESNDELIRMLYILGVPMDSSGRIYQLSNAALHLVHREILAVRPTFKGIMLSRRGNANFKEIAAHGIWVKSAYKISATKTNN